MSGLHSTSCRGSPTLSSTTTILLPGIVADLRIVLSLCIYISLLIFLLAVGLVLVNFCLLADRTHRSRQSQTFCLFLAALVALALLFYNRAVYSRYSCLVVLGMPL